MQELRCKICGGKLIIIGDKEVCQNCGTEFSLEKPMPPTPGDSPKTVYNRVLFYNKAGNADSALTECIAGAKKYPQYAPFWQYLIHRREKDIESKIQNEDEFGAPDSKLTYKKDTDYAICPGCGSIVENHICKKCQIRINESDDHLNRYNYSPYKLYYMDRGTFTKSTYTLNEFACSEYINLHHPYAEVNGYGNDFKYADLEFLFSNYNVAEDDGHTKTEEEKKYHDLKASFEKYKTEVFPARAARFENDMKQYVEDLNTEQEEKFNAFKAGSSAIWQEWKDIYDENKEFIKKNGIQETINLLLPDLESQDKGDGSLVPVNAVWIARGDYYSHAAEVAGGVHIGMLKSGIFRKKWKVSIYPELRYYGNEWNGQISGIDEIVDVWGNELILSLDDYTCVEITLSEPIGDMIKNFNSYYSRIRLIGKTD